MKQKTILFKIEKETKNTIRYREISAPGEKPAVEVLYVQKEFLGKEIPQKISVVLSELRPEN